MDIRGLLLANSEHIEGGGQAAAPLATLEVAGKSTLQRMAERVRLTDLNWIDAFVSRERAIDEVVHQLQPAQPLEIGLEFQRRTTMCGAMVAADRASERALCDQQAGRFVHYRGRGLKSDPDIFACGVRAVADHGRGFV